MWGTGTGSEVMRRIASPMVGGMITAPLLSMVVLPAAYYLIYRGRAHLRLVRFHGEEQLTEKPSGRDVVTRS
jgi:Cu(I)/Ag(I) efflux system membrane protein CusA/SilA